MLYYLNVLQLADGSYCLVENGGHAGSQGSIYEYTNVIQYKNGTVTETELGEEAERFDDESPYIYYENGAVIPSNQYKPLVEQFNKDVYSISKLCMLDLGAGGFLDKDTALYNQLKYASYELDDIKRLLSYTGNLDTMYLSGTQAEAFAAVIEAYGSNGCHVGLFDGGGGIPAMMVLENLTSDLGPIQYFSVLGEYGSYYGSPFEGDVLQETLYYWNESTKTVEKKDMTSFFTSGVTILALDGQTLLYLGDSAGGDYVATWSRIYDVHGGDLSLLEDSTTYHFGYESKENVLNSLQERHGASLKIDESHVFSSNNVGYNLTVDSNGVSLAHTYRSYYDFENREDYGALYIGKNLDGGGCRGLWATSDDTVDILRAYAQKVQFRFNFPEFSQNSEVTNLFSDLQLSGTLVECYEIVNQYYYVIMEENGQETAYIIRYIKRNGQVIWEILSQSTEFFTEEQLQEQGNGYLFDSNITLDEAQLEHFTSVTDYVNFFTSALQNIGGASLNDSGKSALTQSMQDSISQFATIILDVKDEVGEIKSEQVSSLVQQAEELISGFMSLLQAENEELNKELEQTVRVVLQGLDEKNWTIYLNPDLINQLDGNNLQIFLASGQQGLEVSAEDLDILLQESGGLFINVQETGIDQYGISFADFEGNSTEKLSAPVKFYFPTTNEFATVMLDYAQGTENWGGQFHSATNMIQFSTIHAGTYRIVDNSVQVNDVSDEYRSMIQFMVSKGFFEVDEYGNFNPNGTITRNDFTKTLVSMFFALDRELTSSFLDVYEDSPYYAYIASGESRAIVAGYDDGYFYGDTVMSEEMAFTLIAQTLVDKKGYVYPEELDFYLNTRTMTGEYNEWAEKGLALTFRDNIVLPSESVTPLAELTRQNAALYLYRLFTLLEERQQVNFSLNEDVLDVLLEISPEEEGGDSLIAYVCVAIGILFLVSGANLLFTKKKKT